MHKHVSAQSHILFYLYTLSMNIINNMWLAYGGLDEKAYSWYQVILAC